MGCSGIEYFGCTFLYSSHHVNETFRQPTPLLYSKHTFILKFLFSRLRSICMSSLDFAAGLASSSPVAVLNNVTKSKAPDGLKTSKVTALCHFNALIFSCSFSTQLWGLSCWFLFSFQSSTDLETSRQDRLSNARPRTVCHLCFKPVHLIQRHLIDGKVYHRSCFR